MADNPTPDPKIERLAAIVEELRRQHDPRRSAAEQAEYAAMSEKYPGQFVAFLDTWDGEKLTRRVIAAAESVAELHSQLRARPDLDAVRRVMTVAQIRDPKDELFVARIASDQDAEPATEGC
jgi:hypothetical protein